MKLPLYHENSQKSSVTTGGNKSNGPGGTSDNKSKTACGVKSTVEIQFEYGHGFMCRVLQLFLLWLPMLLIFFLFSYSLNHQMDSQRLEVALLRTEINLLNAEVNFLKRELVSIRASTTGKNYPKEFAIGKESSSVTYENSDFIFPRQKRSITEGGTEIKNDSSPSHRMLPTNISARRGKQWRKKCNPGKAQCRHPFRRRLSKSNVKCRGFQAIHLKGAHPETVVDSGHVGPWFIDTKAVTDSKMDSSFQLREDGDSIEIKSSGLYFIYAQVYYLTSHSLNSFTIILLSKDSDNPVTLAYCSSNAVSASSTSEVSCFTATLHMLEAGDRVYVQQREKHRRLIMRPGYSFLGLVKFNGI